MLWSSVGEVFRKYAAFGGRSDRDLFERFFMFQVVIGGALTVTLLLSLFAAGFAKGMGAEIPVALTLLFGLVYFLAAIYGLALFLPMTALIVRRLHDTNRSGWWFWGWFVAHTLLWIIYLIVIVSLVATGNDVAVAGAQVLFYFFSIPLSILMYFILYWLAQPGTAGENRFGSALVEFEPDSPVDGLQVQVSGFFRGVGRAWVQNWRRFGIQGRLSRSEYWCFHVLLMPLILLAMILFLTAIGVAVSAGGLAESSVFLLVGFALTAVTLWLSIAAGIRRMHDVNCCGWWVLISFVPPLGALAWIYLLFKPSIAGGNRFGPQPMPML